MSTDRIGAFQCGRRNCPKSFPTEKQLIRHQKESKRCLRQSTEELEAQYNESRRSKRKAAIAKAEDNRKKKKHAKCMPASVVVGVVEDAHLASPPREEPDYQGCPICLDPVLPHEESVESTSCAHKLHEKCYATQMMHYYREQIVKYRTHIRSVMFANVYYSMQRMTREEDFFQFRINTSCAICRTEFVVGEDEGELTDEE